MRSRLAAALVALFVVVPNLALAGDNPWATIKDLFREPVAEIKQQFKQLRPPGRAATAAQPKVAAPEPTTQSPKQTEAAAAPLPVARPSPQTLAGSAAQPLAATLQPSPIQNTPLQGNSPILAEEADTEETLPARAGLAVGPAAVPGEANIASQPAAEAPDEFEDALAPIPRPRPEDAIAFAAVVPKRPSTKSQAAIGALVGPLPGLKKPPPAADSTCGAALARLGVEAKPIAPIREGVCGVLEPVTVAALGGGVTDLTVNAIVGCRLAEVFANWLEDEAQPAARKHLGGEIVGLRVAASYACRSRNNVAGAKLSEHARGKAIDISAFKVEGRGWIEVGGRNGLAAKRFLAAARESACGPFKTVLGPGSDAYHSDHFHFDLAERSKRGKSRGLYCG